MATGLPVISTADGGHGEFLLHNTNALVFEKENTNDLYEKLLNLLSNPALMKRLSKAGRETATVQFSLSRYVRDLEKLLSSVVQGGEP
jgi:glycosyltransferase involved in cell wall biosynthesis